jgi:enamine deaminase RidA (YjgF/YER057c/UK114 family)
MWIFHIENIQEHSMSRTIVNPPDLHDPIPYGYSHVVTAPPGGLVFIAGQYGADASGRIVSTEFGEQVRQSFANLETALRAVGLGFGDVVQIRTYIVDHDAEKLPILGEHLHRTWGTELPAQTLTGVAALALPEMRFEIDAIAIRS